MKQALPFLCACWLVGSVSGGDPTALNPLKQPLFSIDPNSVEIALGYSAAAVLLPPDANVPQDPNFPVGPGFPIVLIRPFELGLVRADDIDGLSLPNSAVDPNEPLALLFSVDRNAQGAVPPDPNLVAQGLPFNVLDQASKNQASGDAFVGTRRFRRSSGILPLRGPGGNNTLAINQGDAGGINFGVSPSGTSPASANPAPRSDVDAGAGTSAGGSALVRRVRRERAGRARATHAEARLDRPPGGAGEVGPRRVSEIRHATYDMRSGKLTPGGPSGPGLRGFSPPCWSSTQTTGYFSSFEPTQLALDWGDLPEGCQRIGCFQLAYATDLLSGVEIDIVFYENDNGFDTFIRNPAAGFRLSSLPHGTSPGVYLGWVVTVVPTHDVQLNAGDLDGDGLGDFSYTYHMRNAPLGGPALAGPLLAGDPNLVPGVENAFDLFSVDPNAPADPNEFLVADLNTLYDGTFWFGGTPFAQFFMELQRKPLLDDALFFSLARGSPTLLAGTIPGSTGSGADVYVDPDPGAPASPQIYATPAQMGLDPNDDIDGLIVFDNGDLFFTPEDQILFSLAPESPYGGPGILYTTNGGGVFAPLIFPQQLGLLPFGDNVNMIDFVPCANRRTCLLSWAIGFLASTSCPGDLNQNGVVDLTDLSILLSNFGTLTGAMHADGDLDNDNDVDLTDLSLMLGGFGESCPPLP